jgi:hypothetical protein
MSNDGLRLIWLLEELDVLVREFYMHAGYK